MSLPPLPPGFRLATPAKRDPWEVLQAEGFVATNGYRTEEDVERIRAQGYKPAKDGAHNRGDGVDLDHPKLSRQAQERRLKELSKEHGWDAFVLDEGHHRHLAIKGWGAAPGTPGTQNSGLPPLPPGAKLVQRGKLSGSDFTPPAADEAPAAGERRATVRTDASSPMQGTPTGEAYDGDTFELSTGANARLRGVDAWERNQKGFRVDGRAVPIGSDARNALLGFISPDTPIQFTGEQTYGRPVASLGTEGNDPAVSMLRDGHAVAAPRFLKGSPEFPTYMQADRLARRNLLGGHGTNAVSPAEHRQGVQPEAVTNEAVFWDEKMPAKIGWPKEVEEAYIALAADPKSTAEDIIGFARKQGSELNPADVERFLKRRAKGDPTHRSVTYDVLPRPMTDLGQGTLGALARGVVDPLNMADEMVGTLHTLGLPSANGDRENVWNSDRRFGDILWNNIDQERDILNYDDAHHPVARFGGQMASALVAPTLAVEGAAARATAKVLEKGGSHWAASQAARTAAGRRYIGTGAIEGGVAGFGAGEGGIVDRAPGAAIGTVVGGAGGLVLGKGMEAAAPVVMRGVNRMRGRSAVMPEGAGLAAVEAAPIINDGVQQVGPTPAARSQPQGGTFNSANDDVPPLPAGYRLADAPAAQGEVVTGPTASELWRLGQDDLIALRDETRLSDKQKLIRALGEDGAKRFDALQRQMNSMDTRRADEASRLFDQEFGNLTPEQERLVYGIGEVEASADELDELIKAHSDVLPGDDANWSAYMGASGLRNSTPEEMAKVVRGEGSVTAQASYVRMGNAMRNLAASGVPEDQIPARMVQALVEQGGWRPEQASEVVQSFVDATRRMGGSPSSAAMRMDDEAAELVGPEVRQRDYINTADLPPLPEGYKLADPPIGRTMQMGDRLSAEQMARLAEDVDPASVLPRPGNIIESMEEAAQANPGRFREVEAPDEFDQLGVRRIPSRNDLFKSKPVRGPLDMTQWLRDAGGLRDDTGDLAHLGIDNSPRKLDFGGHEGFLGKLVREDGMSLDEAGEALTSAGYFKERPTTDELLDALHQERLGNRRFLDEETGEAEGFYSARADRERIEAQAATGSPYVDDVTEEVTLDDLVSNTPPANAYDERPTLTGKLGNINLAYIEKPQDVAQLIQQIQQKVGGFSAASRGRVTNEETQRLAEEMGLKPEQLLKRRQGQSLNAEQLYATRALVQKSREVVGALAKKAVGGDDEAVARFRNAWLRHVAIEEQVAGATSEAGRALQQFKMLAQSGSARGDAVKAYLKGAGGREDIEDVARKLVDLIEDPAQANHFMREAAKPRWRDKINELWINSLLSGPKTHVVNFVGNAVTATLSFPEQALTAGIGLLTRSSDRARFGEVAARAVGMGDSAVEAIKAAKRGFITGEPADAVSKVEAANYHAIGGTLGKIIRTPTRALTASDEFWKTINRSAELRQLAYRKASQEGGDVARVSERYAQLVRSPTDDMVKRSEEAARYYTFQRELGKSGRHIQGWANEWPGAKIIVPFVRTPINLLKFAGERSVFAPLMKEVRTSLRQGGRARDEALARITLGSGISTAAVLAAMEGKVTGGGPTDPGQRAALLQSGWQPYSVKIGDEWVSYQRFDPTSMLIGAAADFAEVGAFAAARERDAFALNLSMAVAKNVTSKTWLSGLSDFFDALSDPERFGKAWAQRLVGSAVVPAIAAQSAQAIDPYMRDARSILDAVKARVPVVSEGLPMRRNVWGEPVKRGESLGPDIISPVYSSPISSDPVKRAVARLRVPLSLPKRFMKVDGQRVDLTAEQYDVLMQLSGQSAKTYLDGFVKTQEWRAMDADERREFVKETLKDFRASARDTLKERYPELGGGKPEPANSNPPPLPPGFAVRR